MRRVENGIAVMAALLAAVASAAPEQLPPTSEVMAELRRIEAAGYRQRADELRLQYQARASERPGDAMPRVFMAWCSLPSDDAWNQLKAVAAIFPDNPWVHYGMGRIYTTWKGMADLARAEFEQVLKRDPKFFPAVTGLGDLARLKEDFAGAEVRYREALALADDPFAHAGLGLALAAQGKADEARAALKKAIAAHPEQPAALSVLVRLCREARDPVAVDAAQALAELRPKDREARKQIAELRLEVGDKAAAAAEFDRLVRLGNADAPVVQRLAELYRELADAEGEERTLRSLSALTNQDPAPELRLAELRLAAKDLPGAQGHWREALARDPKQVEAHVGLGRAKEVAGPLHEALVHYRDALALDGARAEVAEAVKRLEASFKLPKKRARGSANNVYWAVQTSLGKFYEERRAAVPALKGKYSVRVRIAKDGAVLGVDVLQDTVNDVALLGHVYFGLRDAEYGKQKGEPVFDFELAGKKGK